MRKYLNVLLIGFVVLTVPLASRVNIAHADSATFYPPPCAVGEDPNTGATVPATCGEFTETFTIDSLDTLSDIAYIYRSYSDENCGPYVSLATSTSVELMTNPYKNQWSYLVFAKNQLQGATGSLDPMSIFKTDYSNGGPGIGECDSTNIATSTEVTKGLMNFVISKNDSDLLSQSINSSGGAPIPGIDGKFVALDSLLINPYVQTTITDPRKTVDLFYSPLGIYGGNDIVLYKSKEIDTLDDGSKNTITFPPPSIDGVVPFYSTQFTTTTENSSI